ncbi:putative Co/Zn/Cd efflux system membrane fusion protein [Fimbriiglobus ruber]|uniref:Putative Co/Zn/Cd efflux system membrane fusion protein n=1 Tax=Fimbriiglobus ruber TaxID=1908690 RepID=A0A225D554_9BACT|nr:putative Co/Zn/Cd efflux system membrane fusion protein [Fimbriiglobus ruber]
MLALALAACAGCNRSTGATGGSSLSASDAPAVVAVATPKRLDLNWSVEQPGTVQAFETTPLVAKLPGYVKTIPKDLGDPVEADEVLATIDIPELEQEAAQKVAAVGQAEAEVEQARKGIDVAAAHETAAGAMVTEAKAAIARAEADFARWESEVRRVETLVSQKVIDTQTLDETRKQSKSAAATKAEVAARVASAEAALREATARRGRADADLKAAQAHVRLAEADARRMTALLHYREIRSPFKGVITGRYVHTGHFLQPSSGTRSEPLFTVARLDVVRVFVDVPEVAADQVKAGSKAVVRFPALGNREVAGAVTRTARVVNPDTRALRAEIDLQNADGSLTPGTYAMARIAATTKDAYVVPAACVLFADETAYCYAIEGGKAVKLRVRVGRTDPVGYQLLEKRLATVYAGDWQPLTGTEKFAVGNLGALADGQTVTPKEE